MSLNVGNCSRCGKLYAKNNFHDVCNTCVKDIDKMYEVVAKYLRENRGSTINEVSDATEVPYRQIVRFIQEGRISVMNMPNMNFPCESCGAPILQGHICEDCRKKLSRDVRNMSEDEKRREMMNPTRTQGSYNIKDRLNKERF